MGNNKFKASEYVAYNQKVGLYQYKYLHELFNEIFVLLPFEKQQFDSLLDDELQYKFNYDDLTVYIDKKFDFYYAELTGTDKLSLKARIYLHKEKIKKLKKNIIQLKLF